MKKIIAIMISLALLLGCAGAFAEAEPAVKEVIGTITVNGAFTLQCALPEGYKVQPLHLNADQLIAIITSENPEKPVMTLSVAYDETYSDVDRLNDLSDEELAALEETFTVMDPTIELSYGETGYGTRLLIAKQLDDFIDYVDFMTIYKGYFLEFVVTASEAAESKNLTEEEYQMCVDFLTELDFIPADAPKGLDVAGKTFDALIGDYNEADKTLGLTLKAPVKLSAAEVESLEVGSTLTVGGTDYQVETKEQTEDGWLINDELELRAYEDGYHAYLYEAVVMEDLETMTVKLNDSVVFMDGIDPESLEMLDEDTVHTAAEFLEMKQAEAENGPGFAADNVKVTFDADGQLSQIERFYVPWQ